LDTSWISSFLKLYRPQFTGRKLEPKEQGNWYDYFPRRWLVMPQRNIFDETADVIRGFLSLNAAQQALHQYAWQLRTICELIKHTHSIVIQKLEAIEEADSLSNASAVVDELESSALTDSFRANGLCDIFQGFGTSLRKI